MAENASAYRIMLLCLIWLLLSVGELTHVVMIELKTSK